MTYHTAPRSMLGNILVLPHTPCQLSGSGMVSGEEVVGRTDGHSGRLTSWCFQQHAGSQNS